MPSPPSESKSRTRSRIGWIVAALVAIVLAVLGWRTLGPGASATDDPSSQRARNLDAEPEAWQLARRSKPPSLDLRAAAKAAVAGTVRDEAGSPIAGASVCAYADRDELRGAGSPEPTCTRSGADGRYRLEGLWPVNTRISASAPSYVPGAWHLREGGDVRDEVSLQPGASVEPVDIVLASGGVRVTGVVKDISGGEVEGAQIVSGDTTFGVWAFAVAITDEAGAFEIWVKPGVQSFRATSDGYARGSVDAIAPGEFVEIYLTPESVLVGRVVLASSGEPVAGATVRASRNAAATQTADDGTFRLAGLEPGIYKPHATTDELYGETAEQVHLGLGQTSEMVEIRVHPAALVTGRVLVAGKPPGQEVACTRGSVSLARGNEREWSAIERDGSVEFRGVMPGTYEVTVNCAGYISAESYPDLIVADASVPDQIWEVREGLALRGEVVDSLGAGVGGITVIARPIVTEASDARVQVTPSSASSQPEGDFEVAGLLPGSYEVTVSSWGAQARPSPLEPLHVELQAGADRNDLRIELPATGQLRGRIVDARGEPIAGVSIRAEPVETGERFGRAPSTRSDDRGEFVLDHLRPGQTRVSASDGGRWWGGTKLRKPGTTDDDLQGELVDVQAGETAEVELVVESRGGTIRGIVRDEAGGPVADAFIDVERMPDAAGASSARALSRVRWSWNRQPVLTDADGSFTLDDLPEGAFIVRAHRKGGGEAVAEDVAPGSQVELVIAQTGEIAGEVTLADGGAPDTFSIMVSDRTTGVRRRDRYLRTGGAFRLRELPAGHYEVSASSDAGTAEVEIDLGEGEVRDDLKLTLQTLLTVRGRLVALDTGEPVPGLAVFVTGNGRSNFRRPGDGGDRKHVSDADGRFEVEDVPSGTVQLMAWSFTKGEDAKYQRTFQTLKLDSTPREQDIGDIDVVPKRLGAHEQAGDLGFTIREADPTTEPEDVVVTVALVRPDGPAAGTGLEAGDVIESVDGHRVTGLDSSRYHQLTAAPEGTTLELGLADGETIKLTLGPPR